MTISLFIGLIQPYLFHQKNNNLCQRKQLDGHTYQNLECFIDSKSFRPEATVSSVIKERSSIETTKRNDMTNKCSLQQEDFVKRSICFLLPLQNCFDENWITFGYQFFSSPIMKCGKTRFDEAFIKMLPELPRSAALALEYRMQGQAVTNRYKKSCSNYDEILTSRKMLSCTHDQLGNLKKYLNSDSTASHRLEIYSPSICEIVSHALDSCFQPNLCYSELELESLRESMMNIYIIYFEGLFEFSRMQEYLQDNLEDSVNTTFMPNQQQDFDTDKERTTSDIYDIIASISILMKDYRRGQCDLELTETSNIGSALDYIYQKWFTIPLIVVSVIITCYLLVQCSKVTQA